MKCKRCGQEIPAGRLDCEPCLTAIRNSAIRPRRYGRRKVDDGQSGLAFDAAIPFNGPAVVVTPCK